MNEKPTFHSGPRKLVYAYQDELDRLRTIEAAALDVVKDYPVSAGTVAATDADDLGYGSIRALRMALMGNKPDLIKTDDGDKK